MVGNESDVFHRNYPFMESAGYEPEDLPRDASVPARSSRIRMALCEHERSDGVDASAVLMALACLRSIDIAFSEALTLPNNQFMFEPRLGASSVAQANRSWELASFDKFRNLSAFQARVRGQIALAD
jgi:hypothetical protein